jgi:uncharacterized membrane protein
MFTVFLNEVYVGSYSMPHVLFLVCLLPVTAHLIGSRHTKKRQYLWHKRRTTLTSFKNTVNMKTPFAVPWKVQQFPQITMHLMMAE